MNVSFSSGRSRPRRWTSARQACWLALVMTTSLGGVMSAASLAKNEGSSAPAVTPIVINNDFLVVGHSLVTDDAMQAPDRGAKILVALNTFTLSTGGTKRPLKRGDVVVGAPTDLFSPEAGADYYFVVLKRTHPVPQVAELPKPPQKNLTVHEGADFTVYIETLAPGDSRPPHTHNTRLTINVNETDLRNDRGQTFHQIPEEVKFVPESQTHRQLTNVGSLSLRNVVVEFRKPAQP